MSSAGASTATAMLRERAMRFLGVAVLVVRVATWRLATGDREAVSEVAAWMRVPSESGVLAGATRVDVRSVRAAAGRTTPSDT